MRKKGINYILLTVLLSLYMQACGEKSKFQVSPEDLYNCKELRVITTWFNDRRQTISILYGNDRAALAAGNDLRKHQPGERYRLVTWHQQGNPLWFGGQISGRIAFIEQVDITLSADGSIQPKYSITCNELTDSIYCTIPGQERTAYILSRKKIEHL